MTIDEASDRLSRLMGFLAEDAENTALMSDCARAALDADDAELALELFTKLDALEPLDVVIANLAGIAAMRADDQYAAQTWFARALDANADDQNVRFNIAWSMALAKDFEGAAAMLRADMIETLPQAAMLDLQIDHQLGNFPEAQGKMREYLARFPDYAPLQAAASVLAMDLEDAELARETAEKGGEHPDALTTIATLNLGDRNLAQARSQFEQVLAVRPINPRAEIGLGLVALAEGNSADAAVRLDKGANQFVDHLGTWIAAGWAHFLQGDLDTARARFEMALSYDDTFGEAHGSLAVIELLQGECDSAQRRIEIAKRLDREAFSTALAAMLWEQSQGNQEKADQIFRIVSQQTILPNGSTLIDELTKALSRN